jgi:hypothetical protein
MACNRDISTFEETEESHEKSQDSRPPGRDLNPGPFKYEAGVPPTRLRRLIYRIVYFSRHLDSEKIYVYIFYALNFRAYIYIYNNNFTCVILWKLSLTQTYNCVSKQCEFYSGRTVIEIRRIDGTFWRRKARCSYKEFLVYLSFRNA